MANFTQSFEVCTCNHVSLGEIIHAIKEKGANSLKDIGDITDAGTTCGYCRSASGDLGSPKRELYLDQILEKFGK